MTEQNYTILAVFAHPDDEVGAGSTLSYYSDQGVRVVLCCATRGEAATIFCDDCATADTLAAVRTQELRCACDHLGIRDLRWLDWPDGGVKDLPREEATGELVALIRELRPTILLTHPENGLYPHPDHLAVWEMVRAAWDAAADETKYPEAGPVWQTPRLFTRAMPQSIFERAPGLKDFRVELNGQLLPFMGTPDDEIDVTMNVGPWVPRRMAAWSCHISQHNPKGFSSVMPDGLREEMAAREQFILIAGAPLPEGVQSNLFVGLEEGDTYMVDGPAPDASEPAQENPAEPIVSAEFVRLLNSELNRHVSLAEVLRLYERDPREPRHGSLYHQLSAAEQEVIYLLARHLRRLDAGAGRNEPDPTVIREARRRDRPDLRHEFLQNRMEVAYSRFLDLARSALVDDERAVWEELAALARGAVEALK
jgi:LmbE family N-acetylglucosaminyl deacetylase